MFQECDDKHQNVPSWTAFDRLIQESIPSLSTISFRLSIDASLTVMSTVHLVE